MNMRSRTCLVFTILLGLGAASRLGFKPPPGPLFEVLDQMLKGQQQDGPDVKRFSVPAADASMKDIAKLAADLAKERAKEAKGKPSETVSRTKRFYENAETGPMKARGWAYFPIDKSQNAGNGHPAAGMPGMHEPNPGMTAASLAIVILLKAALEDKGAYKKRYRVRVDQAIRDGVAYLAHNWTLSDGRHPYYYLYGLERVGVLTGCHRIGENYWYYEGGKKLLSAQKADGSWGNPAPVVQGGLGGTPNAMPATCFAILFLARATVPIIPEMPERPRTNSAGEQ